MRGPTPKDPALRQRRNRASTEADLEMLPEERKIPPLPGALFGASKIHRLTRSWWKTIWRSPMAPRWLESDIEGLYLVAKLRNDLFNTTDVGLAARLSAEIRQQETRFGLTPIDRRRLDWRIEGSRLPDRSGPVAPPVIEEEDVDPRRRLRAVN